MSTAHLMGMLTGVGLISVSHSPMFLFGVFAVLSPINIWSTTKMLHAAKFEILNQAKLTLLSREFIDSGAVVEYDKLKDREIGFGEWIKPTYGKNKKGGIAVNLKLGPSAEQAYGVAGEVEGVVQVLKVRSVFHLGEAVYLMQWQLARKLPVELSQQYNVGHVPSRRGVQRCDTIHSALAQIPR